MLKPIGVFALTAFLLGMAPAAFGQDACGGKTVKAWGGVSILETAARSKARSAWIRKVTVQKAYGKPYAVWLRAKNQAYACRSVGKRHVCEASATPCRI